MTNKQKYTLYVIVVLVLVAVGLVDMFYFHVLLEPPPLGLDLRGGMNVILTAKAKKGAPVTNKTMEQALFIIEQRVNGLGVTEPEMERQGDRNILIQLPGVKKPDRVLKIIGKTALLEFKPVISAQGGQSILGPALMRGGVEDAKVTFDQTGKPKVDLTFNDKGAKKFDEIAKQYYQKQIAIVLDNKVMSAPTIQATEFRGKAEITGSFTVEKAKELALVLKTGSLPVHLEMSENRTVGPTLGKDSLYAGLKAGIVGLILVALFMVGFYRGFGLINWLALAIFGFLVYLLLSVIGATLTLPTIAGFIFMFGSAADSSIIVFERIKEEARGGKTIRTAMETGYKHGFQTFLDADLVTFITAAIIFLVGVGPIKGFALVLMLGIVCDLFTSFFFTRSALGLLAYVDFFTQPGFLGISSLKEVV